MTRSAYLALSLAMLAVFGAPVLEAPAQQVTTATPFHAVNEGFFEHMGVNWGLKGKNWSFNFGGAGLAQPAFGGFDPHAGARFGWAFKGHGVDGFLNFNAAQGNSRTFTSQVPSVTTMNGMPGIISDTSQSPFVISYIPVVGGFPTIGFYNPARIPPQLQRGFGAYQRPAPNRGNNRGPRARRPVPQGPNLGFRAHDLPDVLPEQDAEDDLVLTGPRVKPQERKGLSPAAKRVVVAQAKRALNNQPATQEDAADWFQRGREAEASGKANVARIYYQMAARRASGELRQQIQGRLDALSPAKRKTP